MPAVPTWLRPQVSTSYFSVRPVLACLQAMTSVPLAEELVPGYGTYGSGGSGGSGGIGSTAYGRAAQPLQQGALVPSYLLSSTAALVSNTSGSGGDLGSYRYRVVTMQCWRSRIDKMAHALRLPCLGFWA